MKPLILFFFSLPALAWAEPRGSANYALTPETIDSGGQRTTSANYTNDGSAGGIAGVSSVVTPAETAKHGYIAQLYEVISLQLAASSTTVNEGSTRQLTATQLLDDLTTLAIPAAAVTWSILSGPLTINTTGLATAAAVYTNTSATARGIHAGNTATLGLTVINTLPDNYGTYAADGITDSWQVLYFGLPPNANAGALFDPDGDGQNNYFEFLSGYEPTNASSRLMTRPVSLIEDVFTMELSRVQRGTNYVFELSTDLVKWKEFTTYYARDTEEHFIMELPALEDRGFYRVRLEPER